MTTPLIAGNVKMNLSRREMEALFTRVVRELDADPAGADVVYCPPFPFLPDAARILSGTRVALGAQNMHWEESGAYTGEVSPRHLEEVGCRYVILGHSERRTLFGETDAGVRRKAAAALGLGLIPIVCVGETEEERTSGATEVVLARQVAGSLGGVDLPDPARLVVAYEPVWAIGTGKVATPGEAQASHGTLRGELRKIFGAEAAPHVRILYGGSVKPSNAADLLREPDIDGALVGGACLEAVSFLGIVRAVPRKGSCG